MEIAYINIILVEGKKKQTAEAIIRSNNHEYRLSVYHDTKGEPRVFFPKNLMKLRREEKQELASRVLETYRDFKSYHQ